MEQIKQRINRLHDLLNTAKKETERQHLLDSIRMLNQKVRETTLCHDKSI
jgi:hypothetical protein